MLFSKQVSHEIVKAQDGGGRCVSQRESNRTSAHVIYTLNSSTRISSGFFPLSYINYIEIGNLFFIISTNLNIL